MRLGPGSRPALLLAGLFFVLALALHPAAGGPGGLALVLGIASLLGVSLALAGALQAIRMRRASAPTDARETRANTVLLTTWLGLAVCGWVAWPAGLNPEIHPFASLLLLGTLVALPAGLVEAGWLRPWGPGTPVRLLSMAALGLGAFVVLLYYRDMRPFVSGADFYFYVCVARDLEQGLRDSSPFRYAYFPGVYVFWRGVMRFVGSRLSDLQTGYVGLLLANAALVGAVVWRGVRALAPAVHGALWYLILCPRYEGLSGVTEPLATLPVLAGLLLWGGRDTRGRLGLLRAAALGAGFGLALYAKQQGIFLALGLLGLLLGGLRVRGAGWRLRPVLALALAGSVVFLAGILLEGEGLEPLRTGLWLALHSHSEGSFRANVVLAATRSWPISVGAVLALAAWSGGLCGPWAERLVPESWFRLGGVCLTGGFATLLQLVRTPYLHYALLGLPFLVAGVWVVAVGLYRRLPALDRRPLAGLLALVLAAIPLARTESRRRFVEVWPVHSAPYPAYDQPWEDVPAVARDLSALKALVQPGEDLLIFPPRRNVVHFRLGTRSLSFPQGYGWTREPRALDSLRSPTLAAVLVITGYLSAVDREVCAWHGCAEAVRELPPAGFVKVATLPTMTLWRRDPAPP